MVFGKITALKSTPAMVNTFAVSPSRTHHRPQERRRHPARPFEAEAGRYHVYLSLACPWSHHVLIYLHLKKLHKIVGVTIVEPMMLDRGWEFQFIGRYSLPSAHKPIPYLAITTLLAIPTAPKKITQGG